MASSLISLGIGDPSGIGFIILDGLWPNASETPVPPTNGDTVTATYQVTGTHTATFQTTATHTAEWG